MSSAAAIGTSWTLFNLSSTGGISIVGRSINGTNGLQPGQTFETVIQNPSAYAFYRGFDILFANSPTNLPPAITRLRSGCWSSIIIPPIGKLWITSGPLLSPYFRRHRRLGHEV